MFVTYTLLHKSLIYASDRIHDDGMGNANYISFHGMTYITLVTAICDWPKHFKHMPYGPFITLTSTFLFSPKCINILYFTKPI